KRGLAERNHRREISSRVVGQLRIEGVCRGNRAIDQNGMTVGRGFGDRIGADRTTGPRPVLDHEGLPDLPADLLEHHARDDVAGDAGGDRENHGHVAGRPVLGRGMTKDGERYRGPKDNLSSNSHWIPPKREWMSGEEDSIAKFGGRRSERRGAGGWKRTSVAT